MAVDLKHYGLAHNMGKNSCEWKSALVGLFCSIVGGLVASQRKKHHLLRWRLLQTT